MDETKTNTNTDANIINFPDNSGEKRDSEERESQTINQKKKKNQITAPGRFWLFIAAFAAALAVAVFVVLDDSGFKGTDAVNTEPISILSTSNHFFSEYREGYVFANDGKILCYNTNQELQWEIDGSKTAPTVKTNGKYVLTYYNKDKLAIMTDGTKTKKIKTDGNVIYGSVNRNGFSTLIVEEEGFKNQIAVYDNEGKSVFKWHNSDKYITSAILSDNNSFLIASEVKFTDNDVSSNILITDIHKKHSIDELNCGDSVICDMKFISKNKFIVVLDNKTVCYSTAKKKKWEIDYSGKNMYTYDISDQNDIALVFGEDDSALSKSIVKYYNCNGRETESFKSKARITQIDMQGRLAMLAYDHEISVVNSKGKEISSCKLKVDMHKGIFMGNKRCVLVVSGSGATLIKIK